MIVGDVPMGADRERGAGGRIRLVMLVNDVSLRGLIPDELAKSFGFFQSKPASAFSPVAVTPDELGEAWRDGKLHGQLRVDLNGAPFGRADAGQDMNFDFGTLIAHAAKTRALGRRHDRRLRHGLQPRRGRRPGQAGRRGRRGLFLHRRTAHGRDLARAARRRRRSCARRPGAHRDAGAGRPLLFGAIDQTVQPR